MRLRSHPFPRNTGPDDPGFTLGKVLSALKAHAAGRGVQVRTQAPQQSCPTCQPPRDDAQSELPSVATTFLV